MLRRQDRVIPPFARAVVIYNPHAGQLRQGRAHRLVRAAEELRALARDVLLVPTNGPRTAGSLAAAAILNGADLIIAAGGDGTISEVVDGMANSHVPLGILPAGTANVLAHEIGMKRHVIGAAIQLLACRPERVSLGKVETSSQDSRHFLMMAGAGFDAEIIYELSAGLKNSLGKLSYFLGGLGRMGRRLGEMEVEFNGQVRRCTFALISKVRNYGGDFEIATEVNLRDSRFELVLFEGSNSWRYLLYLTGVAFRRLPHVPGVSFARAGCVALRSYNAERIHLQADGEMIGALPATIHVVEDALTLLIP